jgi:outer membrane protein OmpA-like peptidoglycan-associated protein
MKGNAIHSAEVSSRGGTPDIVGWTTMGDYSATWAGPLNKELAQYNDRVVMVGSAGRSYGEDKWLLDVSTGITQDPQRARGTVTVGCVGDGDINILLNFGKLNRIPVNSDLGTYDPDAINFVHVDDFMDAHKKWIAGQPVPLKNKKTGKVENHSIDGIATWTPGDENAVTGRPGLVCVASTKDFPNQMPQATYFLESWAKKHPDQIAALLAAAFDAADQINNFPAALAKAGEHSAQVYGERNGQYWSELYRGYPVTDRMGNTVVVGGSMVHNLSDNQVLFGLNGGRNIFESATYMHHAEFIHGLWPDMLPEIAPFSSIFDPSYLQLAARKVPARQQIYHEDFASRQASSSTMSSVDYQDITFETNSEVLTYQARQVLTGVCEQLSTASGVKIMLAGHTDAQGDENYNMDLSRRRAYAVKNFMENYDATTFGGGRIEAQWFGESQPKAYGDTPQAYAQNRRVVITTYRMQ